MGILGLWIYNGFENAAHLSKIKRGSGCLGCRGERGQPIVVIDIASISLCFHLCLGGWINLISPRAEIQTSVCPPPFPSLRFPSIPFLFLCQPASVSQSVFLLLSSIIGNNERSCIKHCGGLHQVWGDSWSHEWVDNIVFKVASVSIRSPELYGKKRLIWLLHKKKSGINFSFQSFVSSIVLFMFCAQINLG